MKTRKFWLRLAGVLVVVLVLVRFIGVAMIPGILDGILKEKGFTSEIEDIDVSVFAGEMRLRGLVIRELEGDAKPLLEVQHVVLDLDMSSTLLGDPLCHRAELDGLTLDLKRTQEHGWNFERLLASEAEAEDEPDEDEEDEEESSEPAAYDLRSPVRLTSLRAQDIHVFLTDEVSEPRIETELTLNMTASQLGAGLGAGQFELIADASGLLDFMRVEGTIGSEEKQAGVALEVDVRGVHPGALSAWLQAVGLKSVADSIDVRAELSLLTEVSGAASETLTVTLDTQAWSVEADGVEALAMDSSHHVVEVSSIALRESQLTGLRARTRLETDGMPAIAGLAWIGTTGSGEAAAPAESVAPASAAEPLSWSLDSFQIRDAALIHEDASSNTDIELRLDELDLADLDSEASQVATLGARLSAPGIFETVQARGELTPSADSLGIAASFDLGGLTPERCQAMLEPLGIEIRITDGAAHGALAATIERGNLAGSLEVSELWLQTGERKTALGSIRVDRFEVGDELHIGEVVISGMRAAVELHENGDLECAGIVLHPAQGASGAQPQASGKPSPEPRPESRESSILRLDHLAWTDLGLEFIDHGNPERSLATTGFGLDVRGLALGAESSCSLSATIAFDRWCEQIMLEGTLETDPVGALDGNLRLAVSGLNGEQFGTVLPQTFGTGEFAVQLGTQLRNESDGLHASLQASELALVIDGQQVVGLSTVSVEELVLDPDGIRLGGLELEGAQLAVPEAKSDQVSTLTIDASLGALQLGSSSPTDFSAHIALDGRPTVLDVQGQLTPDLENLLVTMGVAMQGLTGESLNRLLPPGTAIALEDGVFSVDVEARLQTLTTGGLAGGLIVSEVRLGEAGAEVPAFGLERFELTASNIDAAAEKFEIEHVHALGLELDVTREADGALHVAGLRLESVAQPELEEEIVVLEVTEEDDVPAEVSWARKYDTEPLPTVLLESLDLELASLRFLDRSDPAAVPATFSARFNHEEPLVLLSPDTESHGPLKFTLDCAAPPLAESMIVQFTLAPWENDARATIEVTASGLRGAGLTEVLPELEQQLDGSGLEDGSFQATLESRLITRRRNPVDFGMQNGLGFEVAIRDVALRNGGEEKPLASLGALEVEVERFNPGTGAMKIASVDVSAIQGRARLSERGPVALGVTLLTPTETVDEEEPAEPEEEAPAEPYAGPEIQLGRLTVSGLDFVLTDERTEPETIVPLTSLGFDLERFTTKTLTEPNPFKFALYLGAGDMSLPKPRPVRSALAGFAGAALSAVAGSNDKFEYEMRPAFGEVAVTGNLSLGPEPRGRVNANIDGFELLGFSGLAKESGVEIGGGVLDTWARVKLEGQEGIGIRSNIVFTDLSLDEPPDGPISRYLKLPASLDAVLFALKNNDDEHRIPLDFHVAAGGISGGEIARVAVSTLATIIGSALASAPLRVGDGVTGMLAIPGVEESPVSWVMNLFKPALRLVGLAAKEGPQSEPVDLAYPSGEYTLDEASVAQLGPLLEEVHDRKDFIVCIEHAFGADDQARAQQLANPTEEECFRIATGLRSRKRALMRTRAECAADLATGYAVGGEEGASEMLAKLREVEAELGAIELALDETLVMLRPGSERYAARRTRKALKEIAAARLSAIEAIMAAAMKGDTSARFEIKNARESLMTGEDAARVRVSLKMEPEE